jgi:hypothetical protein
MVIQLLQSAYDGNPTITHIRQWLGAKVMAFTGPEREAVCKRVLDMVERAREADNPPAYFVALCKRPIKDGGLGYRPKRDMDKGGSSSAEPPGEPPAEGLPEEQPFV